MTLFELKIRRAREKEWKQANKQSSRERLIMLPEVNETSQSSNYPSSGIRIIIALKRQAGQVSTLCRLFAHYHWFSWCCTDNNNNSTKQGFNLTLQCLSPSYSIQDKRGDRENAENHYSALIKIFNITYTLTHNSWIDKLRIKLSCLLSHTCYIIFIIRQPIGLSELKRLSALIFVINNNQLPS